MHNSRKLPGSRKLNPPKNDLYCRINEEHSNSFIGKYKEISLLQYSSKQQVMWEQRQHIQPLKQFCFPRVKLSCGLLLLVFHCACWSCISPKWPFFKNSKLLKKLQRVNSSTNPRGLATAAHWQYQAWAGTRVVPSHSLKLPATQQLQWVGHWRRQPKSSEMGAESTPHRILLFCLAQRRQTEITQKEQGLKITLINAERCWGRNSMWYQVKNTCFSQVQTRTTHRLLGCSKDKD